MGFNRLRVKENAKVHYNVNKWNNVLVFLIYTVISGCISIIVNADSDFGVYAVLMGLLSVAINICVTNVITLGFRGWYQKAIHREKLSIGSMFDGFKYNYGDNLLMMLLKNIYIALWSLLLLVPGIVKTYSYSMAEFIKSENPNIPANRAIELSKIMTNGHKADLFVLDLSFIGWHLLSCLTFGILEIVYVGPYYVAACAFAYEEIKAEAIAEGKINAAEFEYISVE